MRNLLIVGAGGLGREVLTYLEDSNAATRVKGFLDSRMHALDGYSRPVGIVGDPLTYHPLDGETFIAAIGDPRARFEFTRELRDSHEAVFETFIHPTAAITRHSRLEQGCLIMPRVGISVDIAIGAFTCIQEYTIIGHDVQIGAWCQINGHCTIAGGAKIGNFVTIHPNSVVTTGAVIGDGVTVGAGSVVIGRIPAGITVLGNPAKRFEFR